MFATCRICLKEKELDKTKKCEDCATHLKENSMRVKKRKGANKGFFLVQTIERYEAIPLNFPYLSQYLGAEHKTP